MVEQQLVPSLLQNYWKNCHSKITNKRSFDCCYGHRCDGAFYKTLAVLSSRGCLHFSTGLFSIVTITIIINKWFVEKNGLATSIALGFSGLMGALFSPIFSSLITSIGWQGAYLVEAGLLLLLCLPAIIYPFAINPEREGAQAYGQIKIART